MAVSRGEENVVMRDVVVLSKSDLRMRGVSGEFGEVVLVRLWIVTRCNSTVLT